MARRARYQRDNLLFCPWCRKERNRRMFDKHESACRRRAFVKVEQLASKLPRLGRRRARDRDEHYKTTKRLNGRHEEELAPEPIDMQIDAIPAPDNDALDAGAQNDTDVDRGASHPGCLPTSYIRVIHHPNSGLSDDIIHLESDSISSNDNERGASISTSTSAAKSTASLSAEPKLNPYAPFRTLADFEFAELAVTERLSKYAITGLLKGMQGCWVQTGRSRLSFERESDLRQSLERAREFVVRFRSASVQADFEGETHTFEIRYREPWEWLHDLVVDPTLAAEINYHPVKKFLHQGPCVSRIYDQPHTAKTWWKAASKLVHFDGIESCFLPLLIWLDKGLVTKTVKLHPIILRAVFLPSHIRNASGNGGGVLIGFMPIPRDPGDPSDRTGMRAHDWQRFKREVYHKVLGVILESLRLPARFGKRVLCGDGRKRVLFPGIEIAALDGEEACTYCGCRAALANYPCPRCLVHRDDLSDLSTRTELRTTETMSEIYRAAKNASSHTRQENLLAAHGLNFVENALWTIANSDPYKAYSYDTLHSDDIGKWGKHLWPLLLAALEREGCKGMLTEYMDQVPRWYKLKHFSNVTTYEYTDGQSFFDILKCILPCIAPLLPRESALVLCIRAYSRCRLMLDLACATDDRLNRFEMYISDYQHYCTLVSEEYGKDFNFPKQHFLLHAPDDIRDKGVTSNFSTRPGEGFIQEVVQSYRETNRKNLDPQLTRIDENQEAIAQIRMAVNDALRAETIDRHESNVEGHSGGDDGGDSGDEGEGESLPKHFVLQSPADRSFTPAWLISRSNTACSAFNDFEPRLRNFLARELHLPISDNTFLKVRQYRAVKLYFQSSVDWKTDSDILRCNPNFHGRERKDTVLVNTSDLSRLTFARLHGLFRCVYGCEPGDVCDVALVSMFEPVNWKPRTLWAGSETRALRKDSRFVLVDAFIRGAHMIPAFGAKSKQEIFYLNDLIDTDWFLRAGN